MIFPDLHPRGIMIMCDASPAYADVDDEAGIEWQTWGIGDGHFAHPDIDVLFHLHHAPASPGGVKSMDETLAWAAGGNRVYTIWPNDAGTNVFPFDRVVHHFGGGEYFTSSLSYMLAYAIFLIERERVAEVISLRGLYAQDNHERRAQLPCVEFWCGVAYARGVPLMLTHGTSLLQCDELYGYRMPQRAIPAVPLTQDAIARLNHQRWPDMPAPAPREDIPPCRNSKSCCTPTADAEIANQR